MSVLEAILAVVPAEYREPLGAKNSAKEAWEAIAAMHIGSDRAKKATAQLLKQEFANLQRCASDLKSEVATQIVYRARVSLVRSDQKQISCSCKTRS